MSPLMFPTWYRLQITSALSILHQLTKLALAADSRLESRIKQIART
jgi:succinate dehydrogenase cytochrome b subunit